MPTLSLMEQEALEAPRVLAAQFQANQVLLTELVKKIRAADIKIAVTIARGSSDHAATFAKYLLEAHAGMIAASAAPSVYTLYQKKLPVKNCLVIGISQSGASPDIAEMMQSMRTAGALTVAFVNETDSALSRAAEFVVPLLAGKEQAVAATKSYLATLGALIHFVALLTDDKKLLQVLSELPLSLERASQENWSQVMSEYQQVHNTFVVGRSFSFPIAQEAALKFKETTKIHAEAFSGAELLHGPFALVEKNFPLMVFAQQDASFIGIQNIMQRALELGARVFLASPGLNTKGLSEQVMSLSMPPSLHPICDPLMIIQAFYRMIAQLSLARGLNPDAPFNLTKVTKTW